MRNICVLWLGFMLFTAHPFCYGSELKVALQKERIASVKLEISIASIMFVGMLTNVSTFGGETHNEKFLEDTNFVEDQVFAALDDDELWQSFAKSYISARQERLEPERLFPELMEKARADVRFKNLFQLAIPFKLLFSEFEKDYNKTNLPLSAYLEQLVIAKSVKEDLIKAHTLLLERLKELEELSSALSSSEQESFFGNGVELEHYVASSPANKETASMFTKVWNLLLGDEK